MSGQTKSLDLNMRYGTLFNEDNYQNFKADSVRVNASAGASVYLCGVRSIQGALSVGAALKHNAEAYVDSGLYYDIASDVTVLDCN